MKSLHNLLASTGNSFAFTSLSSTNGTEAKSGVTVENPLATTGKLYIQFSNFSTPTTGLTLNLYDSFVDADSWFLNSTVSAYDTATSREISLDNIGHYVKLGYNVEAVELNNIRVILELNNE